MQYLSNIPANSKCLKIDDGYSTRCKNVEVNDSCEIKESGQCDVKTATDNNKCRFNTSYSGCEYYTVDDQNCVLSDTSGSLSCTDGTNLANKDKNKCDFVAKGTNKRCEPRAKTCHLDYLPENTCNAENNCIYKDYRCYTVENDDYCEKKTALLRGMGNILTNVKRHIKNVLNIKIKQNAIVLLK